MFFGNSKLDSALSEVPDNGIVISLLSNSGDLMEVFYKNYLKANHISEEDTSIMKGLSFENIQEERGGWNLSLPSILSGEKVNIIHITNENIYKGNKDHSGDVAILLCELEAFAKKRKKIIITCHQENQDGSCHKHFTGASSDVILYINLDNQVEIRRSRFLS